MTNGVETSAEKRHEFLIQQRDRHLSQFMEINGKAVFAAITPIFFVLLAVDDVQGKFNAAGWLFWAISGVAIFGIALLFVGGYILSNFHTRAIRSIQLRLTGVESPTPSRKGGMFGKISNRFLIALGERKQTEAPKPIFPSWLYTDTPDSKQASDSRPEIRDSDYEIIPNASIANTLIFFGLLLLSSTAIAALVASARMKEPTTPTTETSSFVFPICPVRVAVRSNSAACPPAQPVTSLPTAPAASTTPASD